MVLTYDITLPLRLIYSVTFYEGHKGYYSSHVGQKTSILIVKFLETQMLDSGIPFNCDLKKNAITHLIYGY